MQPDITYERPLTAAAKLTLICSACAIILLFYLFAVAAILFLLVLLALESVVFLIALRFGAATLMFHVLRRHFGLLKIFLQSFRSQKELEFHIPLQPEDAPQLFTLLQRLAERLAMAPPDKVSLEMTVNARVWLKGFRRGKGRTNLAIGYDLLAGLTEAEAEAVLAHEMTHAKLIHRGAKFWLSRGLPRLVTLARALSALVHAYNQAKRQTILLKTFSQTADWITQRAATLIAAYSRQDEFEADRGAAELCGAAPIRSSLLKITSMGQIAARVPWRERVAHLQMPSGFSEWLTKELALSEVSSPTNNLEDALFDKYSTHPLMRDRIAALPPDSEKTSAAQAPAINLLAQPDKIAEKLIVEIQRVGAAQEQKDSKALRRWAHKFQKRWAASPPQFVGVCLILAGLWYAVYCLYMSRGAGIATSILGITAGVVLFRLGRYRDKIVLPVPDYSILKKAWQSEPKEKEELATAEKQIETELRALVAQESRNKKKTQLLVTEAYAALERCDYLRAHVAGRLGRAINKKSVESSIALAIGSAALKQNNQVSWLMNIIRYETAMVSFSSVWAVAWASTLTGDYASAEALLDRLQKQCPTEATFSALLSLSQSGRGKMQSAILSARRAASPPARNKEYSKLLINQLLNGGYLKEVQELLQPLETETLTDPELMSSMVWVKLMQRDTNTAAIWTERLTRTADFDASRLLHLGGAHESTRHEELAATFYQKALTAGHYPEAHICLARLETRRANTEQAQKHLLAALDTVRPLGKGAVGPLPLFHQIIAQLVELNRPIPNCRAWIAKMAEDVSPPAIANQAFMVYAPEQREAESFLAAITTAMQPSSPPLLPQKIHWQLAPKNQQPDGPRRPGVQGIIS